MFPYYLLIIIPFFLEAVESMLQPYQGDVQIKRNSNKSIILFFVIWFVMLSLRSTKCGIDLVNYEHYFGLIAKQNFTDIFRSYDIELLYVVYNWMIAQIYPDFRLLIVLTAFLCTTVMGWFYWKESESAPLTILLFATNAGFLIFYSGLRQSLAMLLVVPAYYFAKHNKVFPFVLIVFFASFFHSSAMVMLLLYPIFHMPLRSRHFIIAISLVSVFFFFSANIFKGILPFLGERYFDRYGVVSETGALNVLILFVLLFIFSFVAVDERKMSSDLLGLRNLLVLATVIQCFASVNMMAMRMNYYYILLIPIFISKIINKPKDDFKDIAQIFKWFLVVFLTFMFFYKGHAANNILRVFPYIPYWE